MSSTARVVGTSGVAMEPPIPGTLLAELREYCVRLARHFGATQAAEDVAQEAMIAYLVAEHVSAPHAWLRTVVVRRLVSLRRRDPHVYEGLDGMPGGDGRRSAATADQVVLFRQVLSRLPAHDRRVLMLKLRGYSYGEMAQRLGCRPSAVGTTVNRTFVRVRRLLQRDLEWGTTEEARRASS